MYLFCIMTSLVEWFTFRHENSYLAAPEVCFFQFFTNSIIEFAAPIRHHHMMLGFQMVYPLMCKSYQSVKHILYSAMKQLKFKGTSASSHQRNHYIQYKIIHEQFGKDWMLSALETFVKLISSRRTFHSRYKVVHSLVCIYNAQVKITLESNNIHASIDYTQKLITCMLLLVCCHIYLMEYKITHYVHCCFLFTTWKKLF